MLYICNSSNTYDSSSQLEHGFQLASQLEFTPLLASSRLAPMPTSKNSIITEAGVEEDVDIEVEDGGEYIF